jgi:hypothetical protein
VEKRNEGTFLMEKGTEETFPCHSLEEKDHNGICLLETQVYCLHFAFKLLMAFLE